MGGAAPEPRPGGSCLVDEFDGERKAEAPEDADSSAEPGCDWRPAVLL